MICDDHTLLSLLKAIDPYDQENLERFYAFAQDYDWFIVMYIIAQDRNAVLVAWYLHRCLLFLSSGLEK